MLTDDGGKKPVATLCDGTEVAILAWRPALGDTTLYRVRATDSGVEGWLPVGSLRGTETAIPLAPTPPPAVPSAPLREESGSRFGQRRG